MNNYMLGVAVAFLFGYKTNGSDLLRISRDGGLLHKHY